MNTHFKAFVTAALSVFLMTGLMAGCTDEPQQDVPDTPQEKPEPEKPGDKPGTEDPTPGDEVISAGDAGEVQYEIINPEGGDTGQEIGKPAVVEGAGDLQMSISQTSSYTDPDGTVFTCEPEARINVSVRLDTVYAKDFNELTELLEYVDPTYSEEGEEPVTHNIDQQFRFGEQTIDLDMDYEVYTYRNSLGQNIGMPYIELREADFGEGGGASAGEITRSSEAGRAMAVCRPSVTIRRAEPATRTIEVEDTAAYNVSVHFGVMVAPKNIAGAENKFEIVEFEVQYIGMVPHTDTYPGAELSYRVEDGEGNALEGSEFTVAPGSSFMLNVVQNSSYTDQDGALSANPVASVTVTTPDTLSIASADELPGLIDRVVFRTVSQSLEGKLPYCVLEDPVMDGEVTVSEEYMSEDGYVTVYKASARYIQEFSFVNVDVPSESPDEIKAFYYTVEYLGKVTNYPGAELSYRVEDGEGNALEGNEFTVAPGSSFMLNVVQNSSYTDQDGALSANPVASVTVTTPDTLSIASADELPGLIDRVVFRTVSQSLEGKLPYCVLEDPVMDGEVTVSEEYMSEDGYVTVYKASARYIQEFSFVNVDVPSESPDEIKAFYYTVEYLGKVTNYPGAELSYRVEDGEGNALEGSEFTVAPGSSFMLNVVQNSSYTDQDGALSANPVAWTKITAPDTLSIDNAEELPALLDKVVIETGADELEGNLPYYRFETPVPDGEVSVAEVFRSGDGKTIVYKAAATYRQKAVPVNKDDAQELEFTYVVEYLGKVSVRLVDVTYDQDVIWEDAHHNIYTNSQCVVTKKATYSDGTVVESKFYSTKNFVQPVVTGTFRDTTGEIEDTNYGLTKNVNSFINHLATGVPDLEHFSYDVCVGDNEFVNWNDYTGTDYWCYLVAYEGPTGTWTEYKHQDTKELYSEAEQKEGCYGKQFGYRSLIPCEYIGDSYHPVRQYKIDLIYKDRFFCIDGRLFTFDPLEHKHSWSVETIETPNRGTCALHTLRADVTWLGRDFVYMVVDTVYVKQPSVATAAPASSSYPPRSSCTSYPTRSGISSRSGSPYVDAPEYQQNEAGGLTLSTGTLPGSAPYTEHTVIRPDGTRTTLRREGIVPDISFDVPGKK